MPEVTKKVAQAIELLKKEHLSVADINDTIDLLQSALDKLCEEAK